MPNSPRQTEAARDAFDRIRQQAEKVRGSGGDRFTCRCPAHEDRAPSLSVKLDDDRVLLHCHAGCEPESVCRAFGLELRDLFDKRPGAGYAWADYRRHVEAVSIGEEKQTDDLVAIKTKREKVRESLNPELPAVLADYAERLAVSTSAVAVRILRQLVADEAWTAADAWARVEVLDKCRAVSPAYVDHVLGHFDPRKRKWIDPPAVEVGADDELPPLLTLDEAETAPAAVLPGLAWRGALAILSGGSKHGKSTFLAGALARLLDKRRPMLFCGRTLPTVEGDIVMFSEMGRARTGRYLREQGWSGERIRADRMRPSGAIVRTIKGHRPALVVVDSLLSLLDADGLKQGGAWDPVVMGGPLRALQAVAVETGTAALVLHHTRKSDSTPADSREVRAAADMEIRFIGFNANGQPCRGDDTPSEPERELRYVGRWEESTWRVTFENGRYAPDTSGDGAGEGEPDPFSRYRKSEPAIREYLIRHPDASDRKALEAGGLKSGGRDNASKVAFLATLRETRIQAAPETEVETASEGASKGASVLPKPIGEAPDPEAGESASGRAGAEAEPEAPADPINRGGVNPAGGAAATREQKDWHLRWEPETWPIGLDTSDIPLTRYLRLDRVFEITTCNGDGSHTTRRPLSGTEVAHWLHLARRWAATPGGETLGNNQGRMTG